MLGAIVGDIVGSRFEWNNIKTKKFELLNRDCCPTDDSVMTLAVAQALLIAGTDGKELSQQAILAMQTAGKTYPNAGYGSVFRKWLRSRSPEPYGSYGNGAAMRVSACGWVGKTLEEIVALSRAITGVTHNHPEGLKGAKATAVCI